ncbi:hypothetical protein NPIL_63571 [Nephila pilipes]|uniref:Uncharacterized protein n=1 Tax=Nephila pilipes TaxID=299642 RepID=A0A8X6N071_NEPPI|nr:hypothetical protein NPIL_63571 [Nephila pilipes]
MLWIGLTINGRTDLNVIKSAVMAQKRRNEIVIPIGAPAFEEDFLCISNLHHSQLVVDILSDKSNLSNKLTCTYFQDMNLTDYVFDTFYIFKCEYF